MTQDIHPARSLSFSIRCNPVDDTHGTLHTPLYSEANTLLITLSLWLRYIYRCTFHSWHYNTRCASSNRNRKFDIFTAPTKGKLFEPAYSQVFIQNKIDRQRTRSRESGRLAGRQTVRRHRWTFLLLHGVVN